MDWKKIDWWIVAAYIVLFCGGMIFSSHIIISLLLCIIGFGLIFVSALVGAKKRRLLFPKSNE